MATLVPHLALRHGDAPLAFLCQGLSLEVVTEQPGEDGTIVHVELRRGDGEGPAGPPLTRHTAPAHGLLTQRAQGAGMTTQLSPTTDSVPLRRPGLFDLTTGSGRAFAAAAAATALAAAAAVGLWVAGDDAADTEVAPASVENVYEGIEATVADAIARGDDPARRIRELFPER